jgi:hypothetical protein
MIKTTTLHTIHATKEQLKKNLYSSYVDILTDGLKEDTVRFFEYDAHRLSEAIQTVDKHGFTGLFKEGYTMVLLDPKDFDFVDEWMNKPKFPNEENLQIVITKDDKSTEIVSHEDLSY